MPESAQSLAVIFFVAFFTSKCEHCTMFFPVAFFVLHVFIWQIMYMFSLSTYWNSLTEMGFPALLEVLVLWFCQGELWNHPLLINCGSCTYQCVTRIIFDAKIFNMVTFAVFDCFYKVIPYVYSWSTVAIFNRTILLDMSNFFVSFLHFFPWQLSKCQSTFFSS